MNNIDLEKFIIGLSKIYLQSPLGDIKLKDVVNMALDSQNLQVDDDFKLTVLQEEQTFKPGDWIVRKDGTSFGPNGRREAQITDVTVNEKNHKYIYWLSANEYISDYVNDFRKWSIKDAKNGDVLATDNGVCIFDGTLEEDRYPFAYCGITKRGFEPYNGNLPFSHDSNIHPATKEQHDLLFQKMHDAGYIWNSRSKMLVEKKLDDIELTLYDWLSSYTCGEIPPERMRRIAIARAREIRETLK